jgi:hypothetical protein
MTKYNDKKHLFKFDESAGEISEFIRWFIATSAADMPEALEAIVAKSKSPGEYDLSFQINGVPVNARRALESIYRQMNHLSNHRAEELVNELFADARDEIAEAMDNFVADLQKRLGDRKFPELPLED